MASPPDPVDPTRVRLAGHDLRRLADMLHATGLLLAFERGAHPALDRIEDVASACTHLASRLLPPPAARPDQPVDQQLAGLCAALQARLPSGVTLTSRIQPLPQRLRCTPEQFEEVVLALVANAFDAMPSGGELTIELSPAPEGRAAHLMIADTGVGFDMVLGDRIFEPFFTTTGGVGLGLSGVREVMTAVRGSTRVESQPGVGTRFETIWPVQPPHEAASGTEPRPRALLLVEQDSAVRSALATVLRGAGHTVTAAAHVKQAEGWLARGGMVELIVTDTPFDAHLPQLVLATSGPEDDHTLRRPCHPERLLAWVARLTAAARTPGRG